MTSVSRSCYALPSFLPLALPKEFFSYPETRPLFELLEEVTHRSSVSRAQAFEDFLHMSVCALSGGAMEEEYLQTVAKHTAGKKGQRGADILARMFGLLVARMEETRTDMKDLLGDLFQGAITYGEAGQFLTPMPICRLMAKMTVAEASVEADRVPTVSDPTCGSGRMLLAVAEEHRNWEFVGQDVDRRCVQMTALNLAFRDLYGYAIHGNTLANEQKLIYRTGFNGQGFIREIALAECPPPVQRTAEEPATPTVPNEDGPPLPTKQLRLF